MIILLLVPLLHFFGASPAITSALAVFCAFEPPVLRRASQLASAIVSLTGTLLDSVTHSLLVFLENVKLSASQINILERPSWRTLRYCCYMFIVLWVVLTSLDPPDEFQGSCIVGNELYLRSNNGIVFDPSGPQIKIGYRSGT